MNADLIAQLLNVLMNTYYDRTAGENARLSTALWDLAYQLRQDGAVREHLRSMRARDYEGHATRLRSARAGGQS